MPSNLSVTEQLAYSTVRIECRLTSGELSTGSGFFFNFLQDNNSFIPAIVTNRHVIENASSGSFCLTEANDDGNPKDKEKLNITLDVFETRWIKHPDDAVDLCIFPIAAVHDYAKRQSKQLFYKAVDQSIMPTQQDIDGLTAMEDVVMIGYPNGIWDSVNNQPIIRRGITATHPAKDYAGKAEFMIDAACFPGSSGSPVFLLNMGGYDTRQGYIIGNTRLKLLGILYAGPQHTATGEVRIINVPTTQQVVSFSTIPNNLGLIIKAHKL